VPDILVDSNVILDIVTSDAKWYTWSAAQLEKLANQHILFINPIIYGEVSIGFDSIEGLNDALPEDYFHREALPWEAAFLAGKCFMQYRKSGGARRSPLPDFFIGAHAAVCGFTLLTRDAKRYKTYFPKLKVIAP